MLQVNIIPAFYWVLLAWSHDKSQIPIKKLYNEFFIINIYVNVVLCDSIGESGHSAKNTRLKFESSGTVILDQIDIYVGLIQWRNCDIPALLHQIMLTWIWDLNIYVNVVLCGYVRWKWTLAKNTHLKFESSGTEILDQIVIYNNLIWWTCDIPTQSHQRTMP